MNGHRTPCRTSAGPHVLPRRQRSLLLSPFLLVILLLALLLAGSLLIAGCGSDGSNEATSTTAAAKSTAPVEGTFPVTVADDTGATLTFEAAPMRIVSVSPASTETLFALGLGDRVVGVTSVDDYPPEAAGIAVKVDYFQPSTEAVVALSPDLVLGDNGNRDALAPVQAEGIQVIIFEAATVDGIYSNITTLGTVTGTTAKAAELVESIKAQIREVTEAAAATGEPLKVFYALDTTLWTCGPGSFVDELLKFVSATNVGAMQGADAAGVQAYYQFSAEQLMAADPDVILLPNTAYASAEEFTADARFAGLRAVREGRVVVINDVIITRPGPRIGEGIKILAEAIHPGIF